MFKLEGTRINVRNIVSTLKALAKVSDFTDDQEKIIRRIVNVFNDGDIPARDVQKINQVLKSKRIRFSCSK